MDSFIHIFSSAVMERITAISATLNIIILVVLGWLIWHPIDFKPGLEDTFHANEGSIFIISTIVAITLTVGTTLNAMVQKQLRKAQNQNDRNQKVIQGQNRAIIQNQKEYIEAVNTLRDQITRNSERDVEQLRIIEKHSIAIENILIELKKFDLSVDEIKKQTESINHRTASIEKLIKLHNADISKLKAKK